MAEQIYDPTGARLSFEENFETTWDLAYWEPGKWTKWNSNLPYGGTYGSSDLRWHKDSPSIFRILQPGIGFIEGRKTGDNFWTGHACTWAPWDRGFAQPYGFFEARLKLPIIEGVWPSFWLLPTTRSVYDTFVELDVMEYYGSIADKYFCNRHIFSNIGGAHSDDETEVTLATSEQLNTSFNQFGCLVTPQETAMYFNRQLVKVWATTHHQPMYPIVGFAGEIDYDWSAVSPDNQYLYIDYVKVWDLPIKGNSAMAPINVRVARQNMQRRRQIRERN